MSIQFLNNEILVTEGNYSFEDIFSEAKIRNKLSYINKFQNTYVIYKNIFIGDKITVCELKAENCSIIIKSELFQVYKKSSLILGRIRTDGSTYNGCTFIMENPVFVYGFGGGAIKNGIRETTETGNLYAYNSIIKSYCFWSWFGTESNVEIIDCFIEGFGRISGINSILRNILIIKGHGKYGSFSTKGKIKEFSDIKVKYIKIENDTNIVNEFGSGNRKCALYYNPKYSGNMIINGGVFENYENLIYTEIGEINKDTNTILLIDSIIKNGYNRLTKGNLTTFIHAYTFAPILKDLNGNNLSFVNITCIDNNNNIIINEKTDKNGRIKGLLPFYTHTGSSFEIGVFSNPYTIKIEKNNIISEFKFIIDKPFIDIPLYFQENIINNQLNNINNQLKIIKNLEYAILGKT